MVTTTFVFAMFVQSRNDWHHVTLVWTGYRVEMYMDGVCKDSASLSGKHSSLRTNSRCFQCYATFY